MEGEGRREKGELREGGRDSTTLGLGLKLFGELCWSKTK